jgi:predicted RNA-binding protein with PUA domain
MNNSQNTIFNNFLKNIFMKIVICGSMKVSAKMLEVSDELQKFGHEVVLPRHTQEYAEMKTSDHIHNESVKNKIENDLIRDYYEKIKASDAILVVNCNLNGVAGYVGGNSFLEVGFAHVLNKKIFLFNEIPDCLFKDELIAMQPVVLKGDLRFIK